MHYAVDVGMRWLSVGALAIAGVAAVGAYVWAGQHDNASASSRPPAKPAWTHPQISHRNAGLIIPTGGLVPRGPQYPTLTIGASGRRVLRLQQLLAARGYLPVAFHQHRGPAPLFWLAPRQGRFHWRFTPPLSLADQWSSTRFTTITRGAVMAFQADRGLTVDGVAGYQVWRALLHSAAAPALRPYPYVVVHETIPQSIQIYRDGRQVFTSAANTGIAAAPTAQGTFPVYLRYTSTTMQGTNPDGTHYSDPGVPWVSYFNGGDAVHGFLRPSYGVPQSLGCVELPYSAAAQAYSLMNYGTLVTVTN